MKPPYWVGDNVYRILPEHPINRFKHSALWCCQNQGDDSHMNETNEGN